VKIKGTAICSLLQAIESVHGKDGVARVLAATPPRLRDVLASARPLEWYPVEVAAAAHAAIRDVLSGGTWDASHALGKEAARIEFTGVHRVMIRAVQYDTVWDRMERAWKLYVSGGDAKWYERGPGHAKAFISGVAGYNPGLWASIAGRSEGMLMLSGAKGAAVTVVDPKSTSCSLDAMWLE
jgi:hypothetical protein